ncbi:MAG: polysaccharide pyruvyl transferase CsaB [Cyanobium sp.]
MSARDSAPAPRRVLLCGYYGEHNLGDDALLQVLIAQLPPGWQPLVTAHDTAQVRQRFRLQVHELETVNRRSLRSVLAALGRCDALVLGGGSLLQDSTSFRSLLYYGVLILNARLRGLPVLLWGQGLGPLRRTRSRVLARLLLSQVSGISWRDDASARLAASWGVQAVQGSDPVWAIEPLAWQGGGGPIVLCWRPVVQLDNRGWRLLLTALEQLAEGFDRPVHWLPFHQDQDSTLLADLKERGLISEQLDRRSHRIDAATPEAAMEHFQTSSLVIAMRLHGLILAALAGAPCAALSYDPKVASAAIALGCPCRDLASTPQGAEASAAEALMHIWAALLDQRPDPARLAPLREATVVHSKLLSRLGEPG